MHESWSLEHSDGDPACGRGRRPGAAGSPLLRPLGSLHLPGQAQAPGHQSAAGAGAGSPQGCSRRLAEKERRGRPRLQRSVVRKELRASLGKMMVVLR